MQKDKSYGGYLPLELGEICGPYHNYGELNQKCFNTANAAIKYVLENVKHKRIYISKYMCPDVINTVMNYAVEVLFYDIDERLMPVNVPDEEDNLIYVTDFFGIMGERTNDYINGIKKASVLHDLSHAFFKKPIMRKGVYNVYSLRKFFGVCDGAYLIGKELPSQEVEQTMGSDYASYLLKSLEQGTNVAYQEKGEVDDYLYNHPSGQSLLSKKICETIEYGRIRNIREKNLEMYQDAFGSFNQIEIEENVCPYIYPLNVHKNVKNELVKKKIYVPTLWNNEYTKIDDTREYYLSEYTLFLPLDQRYGQDDIGYIINEVRKSIQKGSK